jgi:hypothetical protein
VKWTGDFLQVERQPLGHHLGSAEGPRVSTLPATPAECSRCDSMDVTHPPMPAVR